DLAPIDGNKMDLKRIAEINKKGVLVMLSDSTNAEKEGMSLSEKEVAKNLEREFNQATGMIVVSSFASSLPRVQSILNIAYKNKKKVVVLGKSMENNIKLSKKLGKLKVPEDLLVSRK